MPARTPPLALATTLMLAACTGADAPPAGEHAAAEVDTALAALVGVRGSSADDRMRSLGWTSVGGHAVDDTTAVSYWRDGAGGTCIAVSGSDGRVTAVAPATGADCDAAERATREVAAADPGGYRTVCGVMVDGRPVRYVCSVVGGDQHATPTVLKFPDMEMTLTWLEGNKVRIEMQGIVPIQGTWSESEGEVDIFTSDKTWFYIANREAAAQEVQSMTGGAP